MVHPATALRHADPAAISRARRTARARLLRLFEGYEQALPHGLPVPYAPELNPPLWELGHIGWFEEFWLARNPQRLGGTAADPDVARADSALRGADALYHSSKVAHTTRWHLPLPDATRTRRYLQQVRDRSDTLLAQTPADDSALYFHRLALVHELMHLEAWTYMAQHLALDIASAIDVVQPPPTTRDGEQTFEGGSHVMGQADSGFAFDNEGGEHLVEVDPFTVDNAPVTWARYLPFVESGGYGDESLWSSEGWAWRKRSSTGRPRYLIQDDGLWQRACFGRWEPIDPTRPAVNLSLHEAQAWCRWAGRRLPTETEWEFAAIQQGGAFEWGQVWEWTASPFSPYPGFVAHPYRDYSQPWFDGRPVLRGASFATAPEMKHPRYRNYFTADRTDIFAGFRSCAC